MYITCNTRSVEAKNRGVKGISTRLALPLIFSEVPCLSLFSLNLDPTYRSNISWASRAGSKFPYLL